MDRRDDVLAKMLEYKYITDKQFSNAKQDLTKFIAAPKQIHADFKAPYFVNYVLKQLTKQFGSDYLYSGLKIETTLNYKMQKLGDEIIRKGLDKSEGVGANKGALVSIDNQSGYIRAMVGGRNFYVDQFNAVTQGRRQPGSTFKVFDYTAAFERGETTSAPPLQMSLSPTLTTLNTSSRTTTASTVMGVSPALARYSGLKTQSQFKSQKRSA